MCNSSKQAIDGFKVRRKSHTRKPIRLAFKASRFRQTPGDPLIRYFLKNYNLNK